MNKTLGETILDARKAEGYSLRALAERVGVSPSYLSDIENDRRVPSEEVMANIAIQLDLDCGALMAVAGKLSSTAERYLRTHPGAIALVEWLAEKQYSDEELRLLGGW